MQRILPWFVIVAIGLLALVIGVPPTHTYAQSDEWYGIVSSKPAGVAGSWFIGGRTIVATDTTRLDEDDGRLVIGSCASVQFANGVAATIASESSRACPDSGGITSNEQSSDVAWVGRISSRPAGAPGVWVVDGVSFFATSVTPLDIDDGPLTVGSCAAVEFAGSIALKIEAKPEQLCAKDTNMPDSVYHSGHWYGIIRSRPASIDGTWFLGGRSFVATRDTRIDQSSGPLVEGTCVLVTYEGTLAIELASQPPEYCTP